MDFKELACVCAFKTLRRKMKRKRQYWVHPLTTQRLFKGKFYNLYEELRSYPEKLFTYNRMSVSCFDELLNPIRPSITYKDTKWKNAISLEERLCYIKIYFDGEQFPYFIIMDT